MNWNQCFGWIIEMNEVTWMTEWLDELKLMKIGGGVHEKTWMKKWDEKNYEWVNACSSAWMHEWKNEWMNGMKWMKWNETKRNEKRNDWKRMKGN